MKQPMIDPTEADRIGAEIIARRIEEKKEKDRESSIDSWHEAFPHLLGAIFVAAMCFMLTRFNTTSSGDFYLYFLPWFAFLLWSAQHQSLKAHRKIAELTKRLERLEKAEDEKF